MIVPRRTRAAVGLALLGVGAVASAWNAPAGGVLVVGGVVAGAWVLR
ncbi:MAG: hypothetical protein QOE90_2469 [Thermoplasmata archaeon]|jgi:hypothetical protein|nr:hypothetical protein [Thermoplasmata archaeon]